MDEYTILLEHMEKRRKERKRKRIEKEENREMILEMISFFSLPFLVWIILII